MMSSLKKESPLSLIHIAWAFVILLFGCMMVFRMPPFQVMDEYKHFFKAYAMSEGNILCTQDEEGRVGVYIPTEIAHAGSIVGMDNVEYRYDQKVIPEEVERGKNIYPSEERTFIVHTFCETPFWSSAPQALGIAIARSMGADLLTMFYIGRLCNLLISILVLTFALRLLPMGRVFFMIVTLLPMFVQQLSSYSLDAMHYSLLFLFIAYVLRLTFQEKTITSKQIALLAFLSIVGVYAKFGYMLLVALIALIPPKQYASLRAYLLSTGGIILGHVLSFLLLRNIFSAGDIVNEGAINRSEQIWWILNNPLGYLQVLLTSIDTHYNFYIRNLFGVLGWLDYTLHGAHYLLLGALILILMSSKPTEQYRLNGIQRIVLLGTAGLTGVILMTILYVIDDPVGAPVIGLMQGKYFLPLVPLVLLGLYDIRIPEKVKIYGILFITLCSLPAIWFLQQERYYDTYSVDVVPRSSTGMVMKNIDAQTPLKQQFYVRENNLQGISFWIANTLQPEASVLYELRDADCINTIDQSFIRAREIPVPGYYHYRFPIIQDSKDTQYCLQISSSIEHTQTPLQIEVREEDVYSDGRLTLGTEKQEGDMSMILHFGR